VSSSAWFYSDLRAVIRLGLMNGISRSSFEPNSDMTVAQAITLAARIHQLDKDDEITLKNHWFGRKWYKPYLKYALENRLIDQKYDDYSRKELNTPVTRIELIEILYPARQESAYTAINTIADNAIPDIPSTMKHANMVYAWYRAGILTGYTNTPGIDDYSLNPNETVKRSEAACIAARMMESDRRIEFIIAEAPKISG